MRLKKKISSLLTCIIVAVSIAVPSYAAGDLVTNGTFEKNTDGWNPTRAMIEHIREDSHGGSQGCMKIQTTSGYGMASQSLKLEKNVPYQVTAWVKLEKGTKSVPGQIIMGHSGSEYGFVAAGTTVTEEWTKLSAVYKYTGKNKTGAASIYLQLDYNNGCPPITYYLDDISVTPIGQSGPVWRETDTADNEICQNIGFDDAAQGYITKNAGMTVVNGEGYDGSRYSAKVTGTGDFGAIGQSVKMEKGRIYHLSAAVKMDKGQSEFTYAIESDAQREYIKAGEMVYDDWKKIGIDYLYTGEDGQKVNVMLRAGKARVVYWVDDFSVIPGDMSELSMETKIPENSKDQYRVAVNNKILQSPVKPYISNDYMFAELSSLAEGLNLRYTAEGKLITIQRGKYKCQMEVGSFFASNAEETAIPVEAPAYRNGRIMVPVGFLLRSMGLTYSYDNANKTVLVTADEPDERLSALIDHAVSTKKILVGYFGGEVTNGEFMVNQKKNSWRAITTAWLQNYFSDCEVTEVNAALSYTDSKLGVYRIDKDLLSQNPDIVFLDFAADDENQKDAGKTIEGIVRKIKKYNPDTVIVAVNTASTNMLREYIGGAEPKVIEAYREIFDYYNILTVNAGKALAQKIGDVNGITGYLAYDSIAKDKAHAFYAQLVTEALDHALTNADRYHPSELKEALYGEYDNCELILAEQLSGDGFSIKDDDFGKYLWSNQPGAELTYQFKGRNIGIYWQSGPDTGNIEYSIDGKAFKSATSATPNSPRFYLHQYVTLEEDLNTGEHTLKIRVKDEKDSSSSGYNIRVYGLMVE